MMLKKSIIGGIGFVAFGIAALMFLGLRPAPGHNLLHIGCNHTHGPVRTAGEGRRLLDARTLNRQARQQSYQQAIN